MAPAKVELLYARAAEAGQLLDYSAELSSLAGRDTEFKLPAGRGDEFARGGTVRLDSRDAAPMRRGISSLTW